MLTIASTTSVVCLARQAVMLKLASVTIGIASPANISGMTTKYPAFAILSPSLARYVSNTELRPGKAVLLQSIVHKRKTIDIGEIENCSVRFVIRWI